MCYSRGVILKVLSLYFALMYNTAYFITNLMLFDRSHFQHQKSYLRVVEWVALIRFLFGVYHY